MNKFSWLLLVLFVFTVAIPVVYASDEDVVNLPDFPQKLCDALGMPEPDKLFAGQLLACSIVLALFILPTTFACSKFGKDVMVPTLFVGVAAAGFCIAMGWMPVWLFAITCLLIALGLATKFKEMI